MLQMLRVVMLSAVKHNVVVLKVVAPFKIGLLKVLNRYIKLSRDNVDVSISMK
jgi:hypothetical protein